MSRPGREQDLPSFTVMALICPGYILLSEFDKNYETFPEKVRQFPRFMYSLKFFKEINGFEFMLGV